MKKWKKALPLILLVLVLAGLLLAYYILTHPKDTEEEETASDTEMLLGDLTADQITEISYETAEGEGLHFLKESDVWVIPEDPDTETDQQKVYTFVAGVTGVGLKRVIESSAGELEKFGLDTPFVNVKIRDTAGKETELAVSRTFPSANVVYVMLDGDPAHIYVCAPSVRSNFEKVIEDFLPDTETE